jgi:hypothetical protein
MDWLTWWQVWCSVWQRPAPKPPSRGRLITALMLPRSSGRGRAHIASQREVIRNAQRNADDAEKLSGDLKALVDMMEQTSRPCAS